MRRLAFAFLVAAALTIFAAPLLRNEVFTLRDHADYFQPLRYHTADVMRHGHLPLWNPYNASGEPWLANPQTGIFYPPAWLFLALPFATAYTLFLFFHIALLGCGAYLLFDEDEAALVGATALMLSGPVLSLLDISNNLATFAWIPLALACAKRRRDTAGAFALALAFLGGEPFFAAIAALLYAIVVLRDRRPRALAYTAVAAFALCAVQLLPFAAMLRGSDRRAGLPRAEMLRESVPLVDWLRIAIPPPGGTGAFDPHLGQHFIPLVYAGIGAALLALLGVVMRTRRVAPWLALLVAAMVIGAGEHLWPVAELLTRLPLTLFRYPARLIPFGALAIAAMATEGFRALVRQAPHPAFGHPLPEGEGVRAVTIPLPPGEGGAQRRVRGVALAITLIITLDLRVAAQRLLASAPFRADVVPYDRTIGRSSKLLRFGDANAMPRNRAAAISGYLNLYDHRFDAGTAAPVASQRYMQLYDAAAYRGDAHALDRIGAGFVLATRPLPKTRFTPVAHAGNITVNRYNYALPPALLRGEDGAKYGVSVFSVTPALVHVMLRAPVAGTLVVTQQDAPGWSVSVDGKRVTSRTIDGVFRGVDLSRGEHDVVWSYRPPMLIPSVAITSIALLFFIAQFAFVKRAQREKFVPGHSEKQV
jgi:hypothetical protein